MSGAVDELGGSDQVEEAGEGSRGIAEVIPAEKTQSP